MFLCTGTKHTVLFQHSNMLNYTKQQAEQKALLQQHRAMWRCPSTCYMSRLCHNVLLCKVLLQCVYSGIFFFFFFCISQLYLWGSPFLGWDFCICDSFFNPTTEVVTFRLRGWCMLDVFCCRHAPSWDMNVRSFESVRCNACVHRLDHSLYSHLKEFSGNGVRTHVNSKGKMPSTRKILPRGGLNPWCCIKQDSELNTLPTSYSSPKLNSKALCHGKMLLCVTRSQLLLCYNATAESPAYHPWTRVADMSRCYQ